MSAQSKGTASSSSSPSEGPPAASKAKVKEQIKIIVEDLELVLGDLKDVAKELKELMIQMAGRQLGFLPVNPETRKLQFASTKRIKAATTNHQAEPLLIRCVTMKVVDQIDTLTSDLQLEDEMTDSSKTDTLNSSSSSTTASSLEKVKVRGNAPLIRPPAHPSAILTVLRKPNPPPPPPRLTPIKRDEPSRLPPAAKPVKTNGTLLRNGGLPVGPNRVPNGDMCCIPNSNLDKVVVQPLMHRPEKERCSQPGARERVRFSEKVQYHGYCPDCDVRYNIKNREVHLHGEPARVVGKLSHQCPPLPPPPPPLPPFPLENGGLGISPSNSFPPPRPATVPPQTASKPQKTILRKSTTTTV